MMCGVDLGISQVPLARRATRPGWRDPRLWIGVAVVAASVLVGALVLGSSDDTVPVWVASGSLGAGHVLTADDLAVRRVRFDDAGAASLYLRADQQLPPDLRLDRDVGAGELVPAAAVARSARHDVHAVPVAVAPDQVPGGIGAGDVVDVYIRPSTRTACETSSVCDGTPALAGVSVLDAPPAGEGFGSDGGRMLVLALTADQAQRFFGLIDSTDGAALTVVGRG
jgi:hypothetical protein